MAGRAWALTALLFAACDGEPVAVFVEPLADAELDAADALDAEPDAEPDALDASLDAAWLEFGPDASPVVLCKAEIKAEPPCPQAVRSQYAWDVDERADERCAYGPFDCEVSSDPSLLAFKYFSEDGVWSCQPQARFLAYNPTEDQEGKPARINSALRLPSRTQAQIELQVSEVDGCPQVTAALRRFASDERWESVTLDGRELLGGRVTASALSLHRCLPPGRHRLDLRTTRGATRTALFWSQMAAPDHRALWDGALLYRIVVDRELAGDESPELCGLDRWEGGRLSTVLALLDAGYFQRLGVKILWLTPLFQPAERCVNGETTVHGLLPHWPLAPQEWDVLRQIVDRAHAQGLGVITELELNHVIPEHQPPNVPLRVPPDAPPVGEGHLTNPVPYQRWGAQDVDWRQPEAMKLHEDAISALLDLNLDGYYLDHIVGMEPTALVNLKGRLDERLQSDAPILLIGGDLRLNPEDPNAVGREPLPDETRQWIENRHYCDEVGALASPEDFARWAVKATSPQESVLRPALGGLLDVEASAHLNRLAKSADALDSALRHLGTPKPRTQIRYFDPDLSMPRTADEPYSTASLALLVMLALPGPVLLTHGEELGRPPSPRWAPIDKAARDAFLAACPEAPLFPVPGDTLADALCQLLRVRRRHPELASAGVVTKRSTGCFTVTAGETKLRVWLPIGGATCEPIPAERFVRLFPKTDAPAPAILWLKADR